MANYKKPKMKSRGKSYDWSELEAFIKRKYKRDIRDWAGRYNGRSTNDNVEYQDFWHHIVDHHEIHNGGTITIVPEEAMLDENMPEWQKEIYRILIKEFGHEFDALTSW